MAEDDAPGVPLPCQGTPRSHRGATTPDAVWARGHAVVGKGGGGLAERQSSVSSPTHTFTKAGSGEEQLLGCSLDGAGARQGWRVLGVPAQGVLGHSCLSTGKE